MQVLIVAEDEPLARLWAAHLARLGAAVSLAGSETEALSRIEAGPLAALVVDADLARGSALAVADYARLRQPAARVVLVTANRFFSDGSIFALLPNACACLSRGADPADLAAVVQHHARRG